MIEGSVRKCRAERAELRPALRGPGHSRDGLSSATAAVAEWLGPFAVSIIERRVEHEL